MKADARKSGRPSTRPNTRAAIRSAALALFAKRGFDGTSIGDIATLAGLPKANVLYYFGTKDDLWREAVDALFADVDAFYAENWPLRPELSLEGLARTTRLYLKACQRWPAYVQLSNLEGHADTWRMRWIAERHVRRHVRFARAYYRQLIAAGVLPEVDTVFLQNMIAGGGQLLVGQHRLWSAATNASMTQDDFAELYVKNLILLLAPKTTGRS